MDTSEAKLPKMADISQSDITARVLHMLHVAEPLGIIDNKALSKTKAQSCRFFNQKSEKIKNIKPRTFSGHWLSNYTYTTSYLIKGLIHADCKNKENWINDQVNWLIYVQNDDGGFGENNNSYSLNEFIKSNSNISQTALALVGLIEAYEFFKKNKDSQSEKISFSIERGISFIANKSNHTTHFYEPNFTGIIVKNLIFARYELLNAYSSLYVLSRWYDLKD